MQHFYKFISNVLELEDVTPNSLTLKATNELLLLYGFTIQAGDTIQGGPIKADTILGYLQAASTFMRIVGRRAACPLIDPVTQKRYSALEQLLKHVRKWENLPNRRSPVTKRMISDLHTTMKKTHQDSKHQAFYDWLILGAQTGFRRCEWASENPITSLDDFPKADDPLKSIYQCLGKDIILYNNDNQIIRDNELAQTPDHQLRGLTLKYCFQKRQQWLEN
jgi:hypothetical protein